MPSPGVSRSSRVLLTMQGTNVGLLVNPAGAWKTIPKFRRRISSPYGSLVNLAQHRCLKKRNIHQASAHNLSFSLVDKTVRNSTGTAQGIVRYWWSNGAGKILFRIITANEPTRLNQRGREVTIASATRGDEVVAASLMNPCCPSHFPRSSENYQ